MHSTVQSRDGVGTIHQLRSSRDPEEEQRRPPSKGIRDVRQDYEAIKMECLAKGALWEDPSFPATNDSINPQSRQSIVWLRPKDICRDPRMSVDGFTRFDVKQGVLGNCWFLAATAALCSTGNIDLFQHVVPTDNLFSRDYAGIFRFRLWQYGEWKDIVVDDRLPTNGRQLIFARSATENEFWPALLEKAYAKLYGSYEALRGGNTAEAMQDFTGGVTETFTSAEGFPKDLFKIMRKAFERESLMGCSVNSVNSVGNGESKLRNGLVAGHAYSITSVRQITIRGRNVELIRVRNPWANETEWNGAWSDGSREWEDLLESEKKSLGLTFNKDGEFWISFDDFVRNFSVVEMCMTVQNFDDMRVSVGCTKQWMVNPQRGSWKKFVTAGGYGNYPETRFWINPQFTVQVFAPDEDDNKGTLIVALLQKGSRRKNRKLLTIGYSIYQISETQAEPQGKDFFQRHNPVEGSHKYINVREKVGRHRLSPGSYLIIPSTYEPEQEGEFLLRIFSEKPTKFAVIDEDTRSVCKPETKKQAVTQDDRDEMRDLKKLFRQTAGSDLVVDAYELQSILAFKLRTEFKIMGVSLETARSMLAMMDVDHSGRLEYKEFKKLWTDLRRWKKVFFEYDVSRTCSLSSYEMRSALLSSGFRVSNETLKCIVMRYSDLKGFVQFDDFLLCMTRLNTMFEIFQPATGREPASFNLDKIIQTTMYS